MIELPVLLDRKQARVRILPGCRKHIGEWVSRNDTPPVVLVCSDTTVADRYADDVLRGFRAVGLAVDLHTIPPGDGSKSLGQLDAIYRTLGRMRVARDGMLVALGGGVVSDLTGFAAATWMRGIRYATCPTTLEADVDASVGGKTGINHESGKNMVGAFHHADLVAIDPECLRTLPSRDVSAGLAESVKHALIRDVGFLQWHEEHIQAILGLDPETMTELIARNLRIKIGVVQADEKEQGERAVLNFGHTIGHAIEKLADYEMRHGEAVALGMIAAARISNTLGMIDTADVDRILGVLGGLRLPTSLDRPMDVDAILALAAGDKKTRAGRQRWVLLSGLGRTVIRDDVPVPIVREAVASLL